MVEHLITGFDTRKGRVGTHFVELAKIATCARADLDEMVPRLFVELFEQCISPEKIVLSGEIVNRTRPAIVCVEKISVLFGGLFVV